MSEENIIVIIKWGPLLFLLLALLTGMLVGLIKGRRKSLRRTIYVVLFVVACFIFTPKITELLMRVEIQGLTIEGYINKFIEENEQINEIFQEIPALKEVIVYYPNAIFSLVLFLVMTFVILPLSFPLYWIYLIFYTIIEKCIFKYSKYKKDENGKILRNEKGKKIKDKKDKHRLTGAFIMGVQYTVLSSVIFVPVGVITRLYQDGKEASTSKDLSTLEDLQEYKQFINYIDVFNDSIIGKITNSAANKSIAAYLTPIVVEGEKTTMEEDLSNLVVAAVYLEESGLIKLLSGDIDLMTLDLSKINVNKLDQLIEALFKSSTLKSIIGDGVNYVLENHLKDVLVSFTEDNNIVDKVKYSNALEVKEELLRVTDLLKTVINAKLLEAYQKNTTNVVGIANEVSTANVESILNKILSIKILSKAMPGVITKLLKNEGLTKELTEADNNEIVKLVVDMMNFAKSLEIQHLDDITQGNVMDNIVEILYKDGVIKEKSKSSLASFLANAASSNIFSEVLATQLNKLLEQFEINLNGKMLLNVNTKEAWVSELNVLENIFELYQTYKSEEKVDFLLATELLDNLKSTKAMILAFPIAYQKLFPSIGIEVDLDKIQYVDYSQENANEQEVQFYQYWTQQLQHLDVICKELAKLRITSVSDISLDLLELDSNITSLSIIIQEVFTSDLLKDGVSDFLNDTLKDLFVEFEISLGDGAIDNVNSKTIVKPLYIVKDEKEIEVELKDNKYYIGSVEVTYENGKILYQTQEYDANENTIAKIWGRELTNLADILDVIKTGDLLDRTNLSIVLDSVDNMYLLENCKNDLLLYAVKSTGILSTDEFDAIDKTNISFTKEKNILLNVIDKQEVLKDISSIDFATISDETITDLAFVLENVLSSDILGNYAADNIVSLASNVDITLDKATVLSADTWEADLKLMKTAINMNKDSFDRVTIETLLNGIEGSSLLGGIKNQLLLDTARKITIAGVSIPSSLTSDDINYTDEKNAILVASDNLTLLESMSGNEFSLSSVDSEKISELLSVSLKSKMFGNSVIDTLVSVFNDNDIKHDLDTTGNNNLITSIKAVDSKDNWKKEIDLIKSLLEINTKEEVTTTLFTNIENNSVLLGGCKANLLYRMIKEIDKAQPDLDINTEITINSLVENNYKQYKIERDVLLDLVELSTVTNMDNIDTETKDDVADVLNNLADSVVFEASYNDVVNDIVTSMSSNDNLTDWGVSVNSQPQVDDWNVELTSLIAIRDNAQSINNMTLTTLDAELVGTTLDQIDASKIVSGSNAAANAIVKAIAGDSATISKGTHTSWVDAFEEFQSQFEE